MTINEERQYVYQNFQGTGTSLHFAIRSIGSGRKLSEGLKNGVSEHFKIYWIEDGEGLFQIDFQEVRIENSGIFCLSPGQVLHVESAEIRTGYQMSFNKDFYCVETHGKEIACNGILFNNVLRATAIALAPADVPPFRHLVQQMREEMLDPGAAHQAMLETYLRMFLIHALRKLEKQQPELKPGKTETSHPAANFIALVEKHYRKIHSVAKYAEMLYLSPKSLAKRLHSAGYKTPTEVIHDRILLQAKRELRFSDKNIKEIAFELGFEDPAYFSRLFSRKEGASPLAYRSQHQ